MTNDDQGWIEQSRQGDHEAFESLVRKYQRMIYALTFRMSGTAADAEDLTQESFVRAFEQLDTFRAEAKFSSWLYRIAVNQCLNWRKRNERRERLHHAWQEHHANAAPGSQGRSEQVQAALLKLPPEQRAAVVLTVYDEMSHGEAARVLGCSETTVSWRLFLARRKLKQLLRKTESKIAHE